MEHRSLFKFTLFLAIAPVFDTEAVFKVANYPHLTHDIFVERVVRGLEELDQKSGT